MDYICHNTKFKKTETRTADFAGRTGRTGFDHKSDLRENIELFINYFQIKIWKTTSPA